jgi:hypothetical protein
VSGFTITSSSGVDWSQTLVPEPATMSLLTPVLGGLLFRRRTRR